MTPVSDSINRWTQHYKEAVATTRAAEINDYQRLLAWSYACSRESLSLDEYVKVRQRFKLSTDEVYTPLLMATVKDWTNTWPQIVALMVHEPHLERLIVEHIQQYPTTPSDIVAQLGETVPKWSHHNKMQWYQRLDEPSARNVIETLTKGYHNPPRSVQGYIYSALTQIKVGTPEYWRQLQDYVVGKIYTNDDLILKFTEHILTHCPKNIECEKYITRQTNTFIRTNAVAKAAQWASQVANLAPQYANKVMNTLQKGMPVTFSHAPLNSSKFSIDYFLNTDITTGTNANTASYILQSIITSDASIDLKDQAFIRKLSVKGLRVEDLLNQKTWTPGMQAACNYWIASQIHTNMHKIPTHVYTQLKKDVAQIYEKLHNVDLRNPQAYAQWEASHLIDFTKLQNVYSTLCNSWEEQCIMYAQHAMLCQTEYTPVLNLHSLELAV